MYFIKLIMLSLLLLSLISSNAVEIRRDTSIYYSRISVKTLNSSLLTCYTNYFLKTLGGGISIFNSLFKVCFNTLFFQFFVYVLSNLIINLNSFYPRKIVISNIPVLYDLFINKYYYYKQKILNLFGEHYKIIEYCLIIIFILSGASYLISSNDIVSFFLSIELQSFGLYLLPALFRDSELATTGALTYFLLGSLASCFILLGSSLLYGNTGITNLDNLCVVNNINPKSSIKSWYYGSNFLTYCIIVVCVGLLFKISAAPFHFWSPDVYDILPTIVTTFLTTIAKLSIFKFLLDIIYYTYKKGSLFNWTDCLLISSISCLIIGTVVGLTQSRIKKIYAYSTISHLGFILFSLAIYNIQSIKSFVFYLVTYSFSNLNGFIILLAIGFYLYKYVNKTKDYFDLLDYKNSPIQIINQIKGYFYINSYISLSLGIILFSFIGIPPLMGFFAKQTVLSAGLDNGYIFICLIAIITSVIGAVYYLNIIKTVFFSLSEYMDVKIKILGFYKFVFKDYLQKFSFNLNDITLSNCFSLPISVFNLIIVFFNNLMLELENINIVGAANRLNL